MWVFQITLLTNLVTFGVVLWVAIRRPIWYLWAMAVVALCATGAALQQLLSAKGNLFALLFTTVLVLMMSWRFASTRPGSNRRT